MDQADSELRETITHIWPLQAKKMLDLLVPRNDVLNAGKLTVGKIYAGLLLLESWRSTKFGTNAPAGVPVSQLLPILCTSHNTIIRLFCQLHILTDSNEARVSPKRFCPICIYLCVSFEPNVTVTWLGNTRLVVLLMAPYDPHIRVLKLF